MEFDKYKLYLDSVQSPDSDAEFLYKTYKEIRKKTPVLFREDFCGSFALACEWVKLNRCNRAIGVDIDSEPIHYGRENWLKKLKPDQQKRLTILVSDVLKCKAPLADVIAAMNFSYYLFKKRNDLKKYFAACRKGLKRDGILIVDCVGGPACQEPSEEKTKIGKSLIYYWEQESFDPVTNEAVFHIHFKRKGERKREHVFSYDWRMWTIPELREVMEDAGFKRTHVYWEGTTRSGTGDGKFKRVGTGEDCDCWIAYVVGEK